MVAHILVVDDHDLLRDGFRMMLESEGYRVTTACDGQEALEMVAEERPDAVLTDIRMPRMDGWELRRRLLTVCPDLPVIAMSSNSDVIRMRAFIGSPPWSSPSTWTTSSTCFPDCFNPPRSAIPDKVSGCPGD